MKCTFVVWTGYEGDLNDGHHSYESVVTYRHTFETEYEFLGRAFKFDKFLNTSYQHAYYVED